jgi:hypothetical protein
LAWRAASYRDGASLDHPANEFYAEGFLPLAQAALDHGVIIGLAESRVAFVFAR